MDTNIRSLLRHGFKEYGVPLSSEDADKHFIKCYVDHLGVRYTIVAHTYSTKKIININKEERDKELKSKDSVPILLEFQCTIYSIIKNKPLTLRFLNGWDIEDVEREMRQLWEHGQFDYESMNPEEVEAMGEKYGYEV